MSVLVSAALRMTTSRSIHAEAVLLAAPVPPGMGGSGGMGGAQEQEEATGCCSWKSSQSDSSPEKAAEAMGRRSGGELGERAWPCSWDMPGMGMPMLGGRVAEGRGEGAIEEGGLTGEDMGS